MSKTRANYLNVQDNFNLEHQCRLISAAFGFCTYYVGSVLTSPDHRDVDLRCILADEEYAKIMGATEFVEENQYRLKLLNTCVSEWLSSRTGLNVDFQFQKQTQANAEFSGTRSFVGIPIREAKDCREEASGE